MDKKILVVDDEADICEILKFNLESEGYNVDTYNSAEDALKTKVNNYDLMILDIMLPGISGYKLADELRKNRKTECPIIFLSAKNTENDKLTGFSVGADDYITKPFSVREIIARVNAIIKRVKGEKIKQNIKTGNIELDFEKKRVLIDDVKIDLTPHEFMIFELLIKNQGYVFDRQRILNYAWNDNTFVTDRTVDVHITRLRKKLKQYGKYIVSRPGFGYCFEIE